MVVISLLEFTDEKKGTLSSPPWAKQPTLQRLLATPVHYLK